MEKKNDFHKLENHLFTSKNKLFLRLFTPNSNNGFYQQQNSSDQKKYCFYQAQDPISLAG